MATILPFPARPAVEAVTVTVLLDGQPLVVERCPKCHGQTFEAPTVVMAVYPGSDPTMGGE